MSRFFEPSAHQFYTASDGWLFNWLYDQKACNGFITDSPDLKPDLPDLPPRFRLRPQRAGTMIFVTTHQSGPARRTCRGRSQEGSSGLV